MSWKNVALGDVCDITGGGTPSKSNPKYYEGDIPWATVRDMNSDYLELTDFKISKDAVKESSTNIIPKNNVVIATRVGLGKVCILKKDTAINQDLRGIVPKNQNELDVNYLFYWFKSIAKVIVDAGRGATVHGVTLPFVKSLQIPLPPLATQNKIVAKIEAIFAEIDKATAAAEANAKNAEVIFYSILNKLLDENKTGWSSLYLKDACEFINRGISPSYLENANKGILILNQKCVRNHKISFELGRRHDVVKKQVKEERLIRYGDVLVNSTGTGTLGRVAQVVDEILEPTTVDSHVTIVRPNLNKFSAKFFGFMIIQIEDDIKKAGEGSVGQTELSRTTLSEKFKVVFPNDKKLQDSLCLQLTTAKENSIKVKKLMELKLKELVFLKQSILKQAFNGELIKE